jgi:hypothetical protein
MIIRGILDNSLSGQLCIRGFAPIKELAKISQADFSYQRNPIEGREDIITFLETETYLFFPEIILSYKIRHDSVKKSNERPLKVIQSGNKYKSNKDNVEIRIKKIFNSQTDKGVKIIELIIADEYINSKPFHRIDGNHRLLAAETSTADKVERMVAPFCIILGEEFFDGDRLIETQDTKTFDKATKIFFHNINTKTIPLTSEENLKVIIDDKNNFPDTELEVILGKAGIKTRELMDKIGADYLTGIRHIISNQFRTYCIKIFNVLLENSNETDHIVNDVLDALKCIDVLYLENEQLKDNSSFGLLTAFLYYKVTDNTSKFEFFKNWVIENHIFDIKEIKAESIIKIFDKIVEQEIKVFVAMPYFQGNLDIVEEYNTIYRNVINEISRDYGVKISLYPIMQNKGETQDQIQDIINKIQDCHIFIADISDNNANVLYETGWARALKKPTLLFREKSSEKPKSDYANDTYHNYEKSCLNISLSEIARKNILEILNKNYGIPLK